MSVAEVPTSGVQVSARGGTAGFTLDGIGQVTAELAEGYVIFPHALAGKHTVLIRPSREGIEDFIVFESAPPIPKVTYTTKLDGVAGLRLVGNVLEMLDRTGTPVLRIRAPEIVDRDGKTIAAKLGVSGCAVDTNAAPPWDRSTTPPGNTTCAVNVTWRNEDVSYPAVLDPSWVATGSLANARANHTATELNDGRLLVVGGKNSGANQGAEIYDPLTGTWATAASPTTLRYQHLAEKLANGKVLIAGGATADTSPLSSAELYDPVAGTWSSTGSLTTARRFFASVKLQNGKVLAIGGHDGVSGWFSSCELYDPAAGTWSATGSLGTARGGAAATVLDDGRVLVSGGNSSTTFLATAERYDPAAGTWSSAGTFSNGRRQHAQVLTQYGDHVVLGGGYTSQTALTATTSVYDVSANTWGDGPSLSVARGKLSGVMLPGVGAVFGGGQTGTSTYSATTENFTQVPNAVAALSALSASRSNYTMTVLSPLGQVVAAGGYNGSYLATVEIYDSIDHERELGSAPIMVEWTVPSTMKGSYASSTTLSARISNMTTSSETVRLYATASGLDQRLAQRDLGTFSVPARTDRYHPGTTDVTLALSQLPVQSVGLQSQVDLQSVFHEGQSDQVIVPSSNIYYVFSSDYSTATLYGYDGAEFDITDTGSLTSVMTGIAASAAVLTSVGRYWNGSSWVSVNVSAGQNVAHSSYIAAGPRLSRMRDLAWYDNITPDQTSEVAAGANNWKLCATWRAEYIDPQPAGIISALQNNKTVPARYAEYLIESVSGTTHQSWVAKGFLDGEGCTKRWSLPTSSNYKLWQFTDLDAGSNKPFIDVRYGGWNPNYLEYKAPNPNGNGQTPKFDINYPYGSLEVTGVDFTNVSGDKATQQSAGFDVATNVTAQAGLLLADDTMGWQRFGTSRTAPDLLYANIVGPNSGKNSLFKDPRDTDTGYYLAGTGLNCVSGMCYGVFLGPGSYTPHNARYKSVIGHEMGHQLNWHRMGMSYWQHSKPTTVAACTRDFVLDQTAASHCLQSLQDNGFALNEGFAHFVSARAVQAQTSSACTYVYYKEFREDTSAVVSPPVAKSCIGQTKWAYNHCPVSGNTVEWDWLNFLWAINTTSVTNAPISIDQLAAVYQAACGGGNCSLYNSSHALNFQVLSGQIGSLPNPEQRTSFTNSGGAYGVNYP